MENHIIAEILENTAKLMELHGENPFKVKSYQNAAFRIDKTLIPLDGKSPEELEQIDGIGKSLSHKIYALINTRSFPELESLIRITPAGVMDLLKIKGIGPKKVALLWKELHIESPGELLYACNENRLIELKGFGSKTQESIKKNIEFLLSGAGQFHYASAEASALDFIRQMQEMNPSLQFLVSGDLRRKCETIETIVLLADSSHAKDLNSCLASCNPDETLSLNASEKSITFCRPPGQKFEILFYPGAEEAYHLWRTTGNENHISKCYQLKAVEETVLKQEKSEAGIYSRFGLPYLEPEYREGLSEIEKALQGQLPKQLISLHDLKGILHNHSTYSDGKNTLREMALACREMGYQYFGICDHSRSAAYAGGLSIEKVKEQQEEIEALNRELSPFRIFSGIESDILSDGSLDYPDEILAGFDFIVASVHSGLKMDKEKATRRLLNAIRNPYTTILGHPSGRLLLSREGYPIDYEAILRACAEENVIVELNAHPYRLDLDWRWIDVATRLGVKISINPDAHSTGGFRDMYYGVCVARKGFLDLRNTFNALDRDAVSNWFKKKREGFEKRS